MYLHPEAAGAGESAEHRRGSGGGTDGGHGDTYTPHRHPRGRCPLSEPPTPPGSPGSPLRFPRLWLYRSDRSGVPGSLGRKSHRRRFQMSHRPAELLEHPSPRHHHPGDTPPPPRNTGEPPHPRGEPRTGTRRAAHCPAPHGSPPPSSPGGGGCPPNPLLPGTIPPRRAAGEGASAGAVLLSSCSGGIARPRLEETGAMPGWFRASIHPGEGCPRCRQPVWRRRDALPLPCGSPGPGSPSPAPSRGPRSVRWRAEGRRVLRWRGDVPAGTRGASPRGERVLPVCGG